jgi:hypothetical protein
MVAQFSEQQSLASVQASPFLPLRHRRTPVKKLPHRPSRQKSEQHSAAVVQTSFSGLQLVQVLPVPHFVFVPQQRDVL